MEREKVKSEPCHCATGVIATAARWDALRQELGMEVFGEAEGGSRHLERRMSPRERRRSSQDIADGIKRCWSGVLCCLEYIHRYIGRQPQGGELNKTR